MRNVVLRTVASAVVIASLGCAGAIGSGRADDAGGRNAYVIERSDLVNSDRSVLGVMIGRVPNLRVDRTGRCPALSLRGKSSVTQNSNPVVYIDGTRAMDTCILDGVRAADLRRVEVYPAGVAPGTGYTASGTGLVLLFSREN